jgi:hypothetical protein
MQISTASHYLSSWALVPFWVVRVGLLLFHVAYLIYITSLLIRYMDDGLSLYIIYEIRDGGFTRTILSAIAIAVIVACTVLESVCILKHIRTTLSPRFLLLSNVIQNALWTAIFVASMIAYHDRIIRGTGIALTYVYSLLQSVLTLLAHAFNLDHRVSLYGLLFYSAFAYWKESRAGSYKTFVDEEQTAFRPDTSYGGAMRPSSMRSTPEDPISKYEPVREQAV